MPKFFLIFISLILVGCLNKKNKDEIILDIQQGDTKISIIDKLGNPDEIIKCSKNLWWENKFLGEDINETCKSYFIYKVAFLEKWGIGFDKNDKVISKYKYISD